MAGGPNSQGGNPSDPNQKRKLVPGTADEVLFHFCMAMSEDDTTTASDYISTKATGTLAKLRNGELAEAKIEELTDLFMPLTELQSRPDQGEGGNTRSVINGRNQTITFTLKKEKDIYRITELKFTKARQF